MAAFTSGGWVPKEPAVSWLDRASHEGLSLHAWAAEHYAERQDSCLLQHLACTDLGLDCAYYCSSISSEVAAWTRWSPSLDGGSLWAAEKALARAFGIVLHSVTVGYQGLRARCCWCLVGRS